MVGLEQDRGVAAEGVPQRCVAAGVDEALQVIALAVDLGNLAGRRRDWRRGRPGATTTTEVLAHEE